MLENLKNYENIKSAMDAGDNVVVITKWAALNTKANELVNPAESYFFEKETDKAVLFTNEMKTKNVWLPKSQIIFLEKSQKEITKLFMGIEK